jgi:hypothetical protein
MSLSQKNLQKASIIILKPSKTFQKSQKKNEKIVLKKELFFQLNRIPDLQQVTDKFIPCVNP